MRLMYDSTNALDIPADAKMVAGYCDGLFVWDGPSWGRFGNATRVRIAIIASTNDGHVLDVETGAATPAQAPGWARMRRQAGLATPTCYVNRSNWALVETAFDQAREPQPLYWVATLDGTQLPLGNGVIACQYANSTLAGGHYDLSIVADYWPGVDPAGGRPMLIRDSANGSIYIVDASGKRYIGPPEFAAWSAAGFTTHNMTTADIAAIPDAVAAVATTPTKISGTLTGILS